MKTIAMLVCAAALGLAGCATTDHFGSVGRQALHNNQGHVIGYKEILQNKDSGEVYAVVNLFRPVRDNTGDVVGYEEETRHGAVIHDLLRSEEHTSELQSRRDLVCRLLLE